MMGLRYLQSVIFLLLLNVLEIKLAKSRSPYPNPDANGDIIDNILSAMHLEQDEYSPPKSYQHESDGVSREYRFSLDADPVYDETDGTNAHSNARDRIYDGILQHIDEKGHREDIADKNFRQWETVPDNVQKIHDDGLVDITKDMESKSGQNDILKTLKNDNSLREEAKDGVQWEAPDVEQELKSLLDNHDTKRQTISADNGKSKSGAKLSKNEVTIDVKLPGVSVTKDDTYLCTAVKIDNYLEEAGKSIYIKKYIPHAKQTVAHHMLLYGCEHPGLTTPGAVWDCAGLMGNSRSKYPTAPLCPNGRSTILWAWAKDAPAFTLPKDIGFKVGDVTKVKYLVLQVHYKSASVFKGGKKDYSAVTVIASKHRMPRIAGVYVLGTSIGVVLPNETRNFDIYCRYKQRFIVHPFAFRTHTHALGVKVLGYRIRNKIWTLIGEKNPQLPQEFYPVANNLTLRYGDILAARCVMHNFRKVPTSIGYRHTDEMCNFYIMFWTDSRNEKRLDHWEKYCDNGYPWTQWSSLPGYYLRKRQ